MHIIVEERKMRREKGIYKSRVSEESQSLERSVLDS